MGMRAVLYRAMMQDVYDTTRPEVQAWRGESIGSLEELETASPLNVDVPVYHPLVGMDEEEVERRLKEISS